MEVVAVVAEVVGEKHPCWQLLPGPPRATCAAAALQGTPAGSSQGASYCACAGQGGRQMRGVRGQRPQAAACCRPTAAPGAPAEAALADALTGNAPQPL